MGNLTLHPNNVTQLPRKPKTLAAKSPEVSADRYASVPSYARYTFDRAGFLMTSLRTTFSGNFTTPSKKADAISQLADVERLCREAREALSC